MVSVEKIDINAGTAEVKVLPSGQNSCLQVECAISALSNTTISYAELKT